MSHITLAQVLDLASAADLKRDLLEAFSDGSAVEIDAGQVLRVSSPSLQLLAAAIAKGASITNPSGPFCDTAAALDLADALKLAPQEGNDVHV